MSTALHWFKSSYSGDEDDRQCLEFAYSCRTSIYCAGESGAHVPETVHIRDSKNHTDAPTLQVSPTTWSAFILGTRF